jgi:DNA-binding response OmpR family regulator
MQKVVIVNGTMELLDMMQPVLTAGRYDAVFVESNTYAYSRIKRERPALVILCLDMHEPEGFRVLSMLTLDEETREVPLLTCLNEYEIPRMASTAIGRDDNEGMLAPMPAASMN